MDLEIRLLGTIEARRNGHELQLGGSRQHRLLAFLALQPGRPRSVDSVLAAVFPDGDLPADPRQTLRTYVSRLRSSLGDNESIISRDGGYGLAIDENAVDAKRFQQLLRAAHEPSRPASQVLQLLDDALALWSGPALDGYELEAWAQPEAVRLQELRAQAIDDRAQVQIELGLHAEAVAGLRAAVAENPLRERSRRLLMEALQRSGRQAEALRSYQDYRTVLADELGLEPSDDIRALEAAIAEGSLPASTASPQRPLRGYRLLDQVGEGAFAVVYRATQPSVHRDVAIKVIRPELADHPEFVRRFEGEAQTVAALEHPHIVPLYDYWREPGAAYLVMRLFQGGSLEQRLTDHRCTLAETVQLATQIGAALAAAHRAGVIHRDIKPANVFLDRDGNYFLGDFGIATDLEDALAPPTSALPPPLARAYTSPERLRHQPMGPPTDVHGLGIVLVEALAGIGAEPGAALTPSLAAVVARATAERPADRYQTVDELVTAWVEAADEPAAATAELVELRNPYKGLRAFHEADAPDFYGREQLVARIVENLTGSGAGSRFVTVVGPSGSGKSSLVRAGVVPALRAEARGGSDRWLITSVLPGAFPFEELSVALGRLATRASTPLVSLDDRDPRAIARATKEVAPDGGGDVLVVVDQFEELYTLCADDVRARFIGGLVDAVNDPHSRLRVIATLRADFYDRPLRDTTFAPVLEAGMVAVPPLAPDELERAIVEPALQAGARLEPGLASVVAADVRDQPGALPLLQYALTEVFERNDGGLLTVADYEDIGGLSGAVAQRAEELYATGSDAEQRATRRLFTRLVSLGEGTEDTRRRVRLAELGGAPETAAVLDRFGGGRLLSFDRDPQSREPTVELAHEALIREWPRLRAWLDDDRDGLRLQRDLTARAAAWEGAGRDSGELFRGGRLEAAELWASEHPDDLNATESGFLAASVAQRRAEADAERRNVRRIKRGLVLVAVVAVLALLAGGVAWQQQRRASSAAREAALERDAAKAAEFAAETGRLAALAPTFAKANPALAMLLSVEASRRSPGPETWGALQQSLVGAENLVGLLTTDEPLRAVFYDGPDRIVGVGTRAATTWDAATNEVVARTELPTPVRPFGGETDVVQPVAHAAGTLAWLGDDQKVHLLQTSTGAQHTLDLEGVDNLELSRDASRLVVITRAGDVASYRLPDLAPQWTAPGEGPRSVKAVGDEVGVTGLPAEFDLFPVASEIIFGPEDSTVVTARGWKVSTLDAATGALLGATVFPNYATNLTVELTEPARVIGLGGHALSAAELPSLTNVTSLALDSQLYVYETMVAALPGDRVAVLTSQGQVLIMPARSGWQPAPAPFITPQPPPTPSTLETLDPRMGDARALAVSHDGTTAVVGGGTGATLVRVDGGGLLRTAVPRLPDHQYFIGGHDASWVGTASPVNGAVSPEQMLQLRSAARLWSCSQDPCTELTTLGLSPLSEVTAEPDRDLLAVFTNETVQEGTWQFFDGPTLAPVSPALRLSRLGLWLGIARDKSWVAVEDSLSSFQIIELGTGQVMKRYTFDELGVSNPGLAALVGDEALVFDTDSGNSSLLDVMTGQRQPSPIPAGEAAMVVPGHTGTVVATAGLTGEVALRDATTFEVLRRLSTAEPVSFFMSMAFSDDDRFILTIHPSGGRLWEVATGRQIGQLIPTLEATLATALPGEHTHLLTASQQWAQIWDLDVDRWAEIACRAAGRNLTRQEWADVGPRDQPYRATCPQWAEAA